MAVVLESLATWETAGGMSSAGTASDAVSTLPAAEGAELGAACGVAAAGSLR